MQGIVNCLTWIVFWRLKLLNFQQIAKIGHFHVNLYLNVHVICLLDGFSISKSLVHLNPLLKRKVSQPLRDHFCCSCFLDNFNQIYLAVFFGSNSSPEFLYYVCSDRSFYKKLETNEHLFFLYLFLLVFKGNLCLEVSCLVG